MKMVVITSFSCIHALSSVLLCFIHIKGSRLANCNFKMHVCMLTYTICIHDFIISSISSLFHTGGLMDCVLKIYFICSGFFMCVCP